METETERLRFRGSQGGLLAARLERPATQPAVYALFAHCFTCSKDYHAVRRVSEGLARRGIAVLRFDFTGLGESEGDFADTSFSSNLEDLLAAAELLRQRSNAPQLLMGHSLGGAAALMVASRIPECRAVATIGTPSDVCHVCSVIERQAPDLEARGEAEVTLAGRKFRVRKQLLEDLREQNILRAVRELGRALLILHSPADETVPVSDAIRLFETAAYPKAFVSLDGANHLLTRKEDAEQVAALLAAWSSRYVGL